MSYTTMKQKKLPPHYGEDPGMTTREIIEMGILISNVLKVTEKVPPRLQM